MKYVVPFPLPPLYYPHMKHVLGGGGGGINNINRYTTGAQQQSSSSSSSAPRKRLQRVEILKIAEPCPLIDPSQVVVTKGQVLVAEPVLTPYGKRGVLLFALKLSVVFGGGGVVLWALVVVVWCCTNV